MADSGFGSDDVVNRRVNKHLTELLPSQVLDRRDYHLEGQRYLPREQVSNNAETCLCYLEAFVGQNGQFEVHVDRTFDEDTGREWTCSNRVSRDKSVARSPFTYTVRTEVELMEDTHVDGSRTGWAELGTDPVHGGKEAQAAVLLAEKMSHLRARERGSPMDHCGSLSSLGSFSNVVDTGRQIEADWTEIEELLGPDAETIAATTGFEELVSDERRQRAEQKGVEFLEPDYTESLAEYDGRSDRCRSDAQPGEASKPWQTIPADMSAIEAEARLEGIRQRIGDMKDDFRPDSEN